MTEDKPVAWEVEFGNGEVELWSVKDHSSEPAFGETVTALYSKSPSAVRAQAIAECLQIVQDEYVGDGRPLNCNQVERNNAVFQIDSRLSALSPRPTVSEEWIEAQLCKVADAGYEGNGQREAIRAALQSLGYEVTP